MTKEEAEKFIGKYVTMTNDSYKEDYGKDAGINGVVECVSMDEYGIFLMLDYGYAMNIEADGFTVEEIEQPIHDKAVAALVLISELLESGKVTWAEMPPTLVERFNYAIIKNKERGNI